MFSPAKDLVAVQNILMADSEFLKLMKLNSATNVEKLKKIITESRWTDLAAPEVRVCVYFIPSRQTRNDIVIENVLQVECHAPSTQGMLAQRIIERVYKLLHKKSVNCKRLYFYGYLGELPTADGFYCCGNRFSFYAQI